MQSLPAKSKAMLFYGEGSAWIYNKSDIGRDHNRDLS